MYIQVHGQQSTAHEWLLEPCTHCMLQTHGSACKSQLLVLNTIKLLFLASYYDDIIKC